MNSDNFILCYCVTLLFGLMGFVGYGAIKNSPESFYRETFNRSISCRETIGLKQITNLDYICGKLPQISEFHTPSK